MKAIYLTATVTIIIIIVFNGISAMGVAHKFEELNSKLDKVNLCH
jgi:hypothetical protein